MLGLLLVASVILWLIWNAQRTPSVFFHVFLIGITNGAVYGLVALGYTLVYGILELINFAHGDVFMLGGMISVTFAGTFGLNAHSGVVFWLLVLAILLIAMSLCGAINVTVERIAYRPLRHAPRLAPLITAIAMSFILQNVALAWKGPNYVTLPFDTLPQGAIFHIGGLSYRWASLIVVIITVPVLIALLWFVQRTRQGKAMRATAQDREAAAMLGINVNRTISATFALAGALAGAAGLLYAFYFTSVRFDQGFQLGLIAFTAAVLGGIGNLTGAVFGAVLIGLIQSFNNGLEWHTPGSDWTQSIVFAILILILVFRPEGLLGERTPEGA
jgi:branched-chain amino acid transport system permease protein